jgi:hypothetical protein
VDVRNASTTPSTNADETDRNVRRFSHARFKGFFDLVRTTLHQWAAATRPGDDNHSSNADASSSKFDQDGIRVFPHSVEHDLLAVGGHIEGPRGGVVEAGQLA